MRKFLFLFILLVSSSVFANSNSRDLALFHTLFTHWTDNFNQRKLAPTCALFSKSVVADYRGIPQRNYVSICDGFKKIFNDEKFQYRYRFKLHDVYRSQNLAAVRVTWYLTVYEDGKKVSETQDEGLDVFQKSKMGRWEIVNYLSYEK